MLDEVKEDGVRDQGVPRHTESLELPSLVVLCQLANV